MTDDRGTAPAPVRNVLITGAAGTIGRALKDRLADDFTLSFLTHSPADFPSHVADIADLDAIRPAFRGMQAIVHLAASASVASTWDDVLHDNLIGMRNVLEAARLEGVDRFVFASSNHTIGMYEIENAPGLYRLDDDRVYDQNVPVRPDSLYGVSKVYGEALGRYYHEAYGMAVYNLRIGSVRHDDDPYSDEVLHGGIAGLSVSPDELRARMRCTWLSKDDIAQLVRRCLTVDRPRWATVYGISNNPRQFWDLSHARAVLGYEPKDGAAF